LAVLVHDGINVDKGVAGENPRPVWGFDPVDILVETSLDGAFVHQADEFLDNSEGDSLFVFIKSEEAASESHLVVGGWGFDEDGLNLSRSRNKRLNLSLRFSGILFSAHESIERGVESWYGWSRSRPRHDMAHVSHWDNY
jgi:hypothetical protein